MSHIQYPDITSFSFIYFPSTAFRLLALFFKMVFIAFYLSTLFFLRRDGFLISSLGGYILYR